MSRLPTFWNESPPNDADRWRRCSTLRRDRHFLREDIDLITLHPIPAFAVGLTLCGLPAAAEPASHDGAWSVELVTESGVCSARYSYAVAIRDGQVRLASAPSGARVNGRVAPDGTVGITVSNGTASGTGTGRLRGGSGSGTWSASALCSGRWTARRGDNHAAQAG